MGNEPAKSDVAEEMKRESGIQVGVLPAEANGDKLVWLLLNASGFAPTAHQVTLKTLCCNRQEAQPLALLLWIGTIDVVKVDMSYVRYKTTYTWVEICMPMNYT